jgi:hypothetical protein
MKKNKQNKKRISSFIFLFFLIFSSCNSEVSFSLNVKDKRLKSLNGFCIRKIKNNEFHIYMNSNDSCDAKIRINNTKMSLLVGDKIFPICDSRPYFKEKLTDTVINNSNEILVFNNYQNTKNISKLIFEYRRRYNPFKIEILINKTEGILKISKLDRYYYESIDFKTDIVIHKRIDENINSL